MIKNAAYIRESESIINIEMDLG